MGQACSRLCGYTNEQNNVLATTYSLKVRAKQIMAGGNVMKIYKDM